MSINSANFPIINGNSFMKFSNRPDDKIYWRCSRSRGGHDNNCTASVTTSNLTKQIFSCYYAPDDERCIMISQRNDKLIKRAKLETDKMLMANDMDRTPVSAVYTKILNKLYEIPHNADLQTDLKSRSDIPKYNNVNNHITGF